MPISVVFRFASMAACNRGCSTNRNPHNPREPHELGKHRHLGRGRLVSTLSRLASLPRSITKGRNTGGLSSGSPSAKPVKGSPNLTPVHLRVSPQGTLTSPLRLPDFATRAMKKTKGHQVLTEKWRLRSESNRRTRLCRPLHNHSATQPLKKERLARSFRSSTGLMIGFGPDDWIWSGKRDSNSRPQPWQGCALPTELFPPDRTQIVWSERFLSRTRSDFFEKTEIAGDRLAMRSRIECPDERFATP